jgi:hypothetical protein
MTSFFTTFNAGVPIDKRADHFRPAAAEASDAPALQVAPSRRQRFADTVVRAISPLMAAWRRLRL